MAKNINNTGEGDVESVISIIERRIEFLQTIKASVIHAFGLPTPLITVLSDEERKAPHPKPKPVKKSSAGTRKVNPNGKVYVARGSNQELILTVMHKAGGPLSSEEILSRMQAKGWSTTSTNPRSLLGVTLGAMRKRGVVRKVGADWELAPDAVLPLEEPTPAEQQVVS